jgi:hypothetical protein
MGARSELRPKKPPLKARPERAESRAQVPEQHEQLHGSLQYRRVQQRSNRGKPHSGSHHHHASGQLGRHDENRREPDVLVRRRNSLEERCRHPEQNDQPDQGSIGNEGGIAEQCCEHFGGNHQEQTGQCSHERMKEQDVQHDRRLALWLPRQEIERTEANAERQNRLSGRDHQERLLVETELHEAQNTNEQQRHDKGECESQHLRRDQPEGLRCQTWCQEDVGTRQGRFPVSPSAASSVWSSIVTDSRVPGVIE